MSWKKPAINGITIILVTLILVFFIPKDTSWSLEYVLQLVDRYGLPLVVFVLVALWLKPNVDRIINIILDLLERTSNIEKKDEKKVQKYQDHFIEFMDISAQINQLLREFLNECGADRAYLFQYHNGGHAVNGLDFVKCSNTHEVVSRGTKPQITGLQNLPVAMFHMWNQRVVGRSALACADVGCLAEEGDNTSYEMLKMQGIKSIYVVGVYDLAGVVPLGFVGVDYCKEQFAMDDAELEKLRDVSSKISALLCVSEYMQCSMLDGGGK